jgi:hypothetical protein
MYISTEAPIFHCFHASCEKSGTIRKLIRKIHGTDISDAFVDKSKIEDLKHKKNILRKASKKTDYLLPEIREGEFRNKEFYLRKRLKFANVNLREVKGLIFDFFKFVDMNNLPVEGNLYRLLDYLQTNFIGFLTEHRTFAACRNVDSTHSMSFHKLILNRSFGWYDYYQLKGQNRNSNTIVLAEGIFDIFAEQIYDSLNIDRNVRLYASAFSSRYSSLIHSIVYHEQLFRPDVIVLSDSDVSKKKYEELAYFNKHVINSLKLYYNKAGKDFNIMPATPVKNVFRNEETRYVQYKKRKAQRNLRANGRFRTPLS